MQVGVTRMTEAPTAGGYRGKSHLSASMITTPDSENQRLLTRSPLNQRHYLAEMSTGATRSLV